MKTTLYYWRHFWLSNLCLIKFATEVIKRSFQGEKLLSPSAPNQINQEDEPIEMGIYEYDFCCDYLKIIRKNITQFMFVKNAPNKFCIVFPTNQIPDLHHLLILRCIDACGLQLSSCETVLDNFVYTVSIA